jgi:opacity protein-like surface antigen
MQERPGDAFIQLCSDRNNFEETDMRKVFFIASLLFFLPLPAIAQDAPAVEVFGGYSYFRAEEGRVSSNDLHGWNASVAANLNRWFGLVVDVSGHYDSDSSLTEISVPGVPPISFRVDSHRNIHTLLVGPRFSYRKVDRITPFAHILVGGARVHTKAESEIDGTNNISFSFNDTAFAAAVGGGLDVRLSRGIALRLVQLDYLLLRSGGSTQNNARASVGIVFRFGRQ